MYLNASKDLSDELGFNKNADGVSLREIST